ncbi:MAG: IclR family transcriptional regulator [Gammaproteobacteria bacterium]
MRNNTTHPSNHVLPRAAIKPLLLDFEDRYAPENHDGKFVTALARGLDVLRAFQSCNGAMSNKELAQTTGIPKPTICRLTYTLKQLGFLTQPRRNGKYELSAGVLSLGYPLLSGLRIRHIAHDHMTELAKISGCTVALASRVKLNMVYVDECYGNSSTTLRVDIGARIELARSSIGRAYLAGIKQDEREQLFEQLEHVYGDGWPQLKQRILDAILQIDEHGFCLVDREWRHDTRTIAVPLISQDGNTVMAMSCGGPTFSVSREMLEQDLGPRLVHISQTDNLFLGR